MGNRKQAEELAKALTEAAESASGWEAFELLFAKNPQPMWIYDRPTLRFLDVNEAAVAKYGYTRDEFLTMKLTDIRPPEDVARLQGITSGPLRKGYKISTGWRHRHRNGAWIWVNIHSHEIAYRGHDAALVMAADVTELYGLIEKLEEQTLYFQQLFSNSPDGIVLLDREGRILDANESFQSMFGYTLDELKGHTPLSMIVPEEQVEQSLAAFSGNVEHNASTRMTAVRRHKDGRLLEVEILAYPLNIKDKELGVFAIYHDVTEAQQALRELEYRARHDVLTGLANRNEFMARLEAALHGVQEHDAQHALLYLDIDQFKVINDTCGYSAGDRVIVELSRLLSDTLRDTDIVARLGGDEFGVLLHDCDRDGALQRAQQLIEDVGQYRFVWLSRRFPVAASVGIVEVTPEMLSVEELLSIADAACRTAKEKGRNRTQLYSITDEHFLSRKDEMEWVARLNAALENDSFVLFHQRFGALSGTEQGVRHGEILIRYRDGDGRLVGPGAFVPSAERYNLMPAIDRWVLRQVCERAVRQGDCGILSINVSGTTLSDEKFPDEVKHLLDTTGMNAASLCFEITETAAISNLPLATRFIDEMKALGCSISLDDFGSGMSSFSYLRDLAVDYLKIDGTFVRNLHRNPVDRAMTEAISNVGKILGLKTVAEFVENDEILAELRRIGVDYAQGYGVHRPEPWLEQE